MPEGLATLLGVPLMECSAKADHNVQEAFQNVAEQVYDKTGGAQQSHGAGAREGGGGGEGAVRLDAYTLAANRHFERCCA